MLRYILFRTYYFEEVLIIVRDYILFKLYALLFVENDYWLMLLY